MKQFALLTFLKLCDTIFSEVFKEESMVFGALHWAGFIFMAFVFLYGLFVFVDWRKHKWRSLAFSPEQTSFFFGTTFDFHRFLKLVFLGVSGALFSFVLLDPRWGLIQRTERIEGVDIVIVLDISQSMLCEDTPGVTRLQQARDVVFDLMARTGNNRLGLVMFASQGYPVFPLTFDYEVLSLWLQEANPMMVSDQGSNLEDGIEKALTLFEKNTLSHRVILLLSDGEDLEFHPLKAADHARSLGVQIVAVGIGSLEGAFVPVYNETGQKTGYLTMNGKEVISRLRKDTLSDIVKKTDGVLLTSRETDRLLGFLNSLKKNSYGKQSYEALQAQFQYFLLPALLLWLLAILWPTRWNLSPLVLCLLVLGITSSPSYGNDASRGTKLYLKGQYEDARNAFQKAVVRNPRSQKLRYNLASSFAQTQEFDKAIAQFASLTNAVSSDLAIKSLYDLGTTLALAGQNEEALSVYRELLSRIQPYHSLYSNTLENILFLQRQQQNQQNQSNSQSSSQQPNQKPRQNKSQSQPQTNQPLPQNQNAEAILNLVQQEERKNLQKIPLASEKRARYPW